jgi:TatD DNase family protein
VIPTLVDTHCHLDARQFADEGYEAVLQRAAAAGVRTVVTIGTDEASSRTATDIAATQPAVFAAVGVDPNDAQDWGPERLEAIEALVARPRVVAVGEIGLDYYWDRVPREIQRRAFLDQLDLAARSGLPVVIHNREADADAQSILVDWAADLPTRERPAGVMHCFSGSSEMAARLTDAGFLISFAGNVTYPKADGLQAACRTVPDDALVLETDAPYLAPQSHRGQRNEPARVREITAFVADLRGCTEANLAAATTANAARLFGWGPA